MSDTENQLDMLGVDDDFERLMQQLDKLPDASRAEVMQQIPARLQSIMALFVLELTPLVKRPEKVAQRLVFRLANNLDGRYTYLPRNEKLKAALRDIEIYNKQCKGASIEDLAIQYKLTTTQIYNILRDQVRAYRKRKQLELF